MARTEPAAVGLAHPTVVPANAETSDGAADPGRATTGSATGAGRDDGTAAAGTRPEPADADVMGPHPTVRVGDDRGD